LSYLKRNPLREVPAVAIYYQILLTLTESKNENHYRKLKLLLSKHQNKFPKQGMRDMYGFAQNYCIRQLNSGKPKYLKELFDWYKLLLKREIIFEGKQLSQFDFKNIVTVGLRMEEFAWTKKFIEQYKHHISKEFQENSIAYNLSHFYFAKQEYKKAKKLLLSVRFTDMYYQLDAKSMLLKTYYELNEINPLNSLLDAFRVNLRRSKKISEYQRLTYLNLLGFVKKLIRINASPPTPLQKRGEKKKLNELKKEISKTTEVADKKWLLKKVEE